MEAIQFINISPEDLSRMIVESVQQLMQPKDDEVLLTQTEVAEFYRVSVQTIIKWQASGKIKAYGIANERRYKKSELLGNLIQLKS